MPRIVAVTVYPGQARITRRGTAVLEAGHRQVVVGGLPRGLRQDSVRVNGRGPATVLGVDDRVRVERELVRRAAGKAVLGSTRRHEAAYKITVGNYGPRTATVAVLDQIPVSRDDSIVVPDVHCETRRAEVQHLTCLLAEQGMSKRNTWGVEVHDMGHRTWSAMCGWARVRG